MTRTPILPVSVQIVLEDTPLLRITCTGTTVTDYILSPSQLLTLSESALRIYNGLSNRLKS